MGNRRLFRTLAWSLTAVAVFFTFSPVALRSAVSLNSDLERMSVVALITGAFAVGYPKHRRIIIFLIVVLIGLLELLQNVAPGRHGRMHDYFLKAVAAPIGLSVALLAETSLAWILSLRRQKSS
jgi:hypothetical protein